MRFDPPGHDPTRPLPQPCGTASAFARRSQGLRAALDALVLETRVTDLSLVVTLTPRQRGEALCVNVHHADSPTSGYPFLDTTVSVPIGTEPVEVELARAGRTSPFHLVFQNGDAFVARTVG